MVAGLILVLGLVRAVRPGIRSRRRESAPPRPEERPRLPASGPTRGVREVREPDEVPHARDESERHPAPAARERNIGQQAQRGPEASALGLRFRSRRVGPSSARLLHRIRGHSDSSGPAPESPRPSTSRRATTLPRSCPSIREKPRLFVIAVARNPRWRLPARGGD
ncbi:DUF6479 family protein [Streptomyces sp. NBC_01622]|uniref:DUF6479 family protein n=1 Tax=Streptomyces sp. NBC_01622 TaxID=2975903 RepID=UPI003867DB0A|nr:DUF6479 family protein [Streptomyces sp. NBC_01622]